MVTCLQTIADALRALGIKRSFGLPGGETLGFIEACRHSGIEFILTRHEAVAAFMADVTGQLTGIPGVCLSTLGPGATNLVNGVANAYLDRSPVLAFTAQLSTASQPYASHQFIALDRLFEPITKKVFTFSGQDSDAIVNEGFNLAITYPRGPVHLCLPSDIGTIEEKKVSKDSGFKITNSLQSINHDLFSQAIKTIYNAKKPLIILGIGIDPGQNTHLIRQFIKKNRIPVMSTAKAKGIFPESELMYLGTVSGMMADDLIVEKIMESDLVIGIGFDPVESDKTWHKEIPLLSLNHYSIAYRDFIPNMEIVGPLNSILDLLMEEDFSHHGWVDEEFIHFKESIRRKLLPSPPQIKDLFSPYEIILSVREILPNNAIVTTDVGAHKLLMAQLWEAYQPLTYLVSNGLSSMGYGLPAAMAAKLVFPHSPVVCFTGDGGFSMVLQDLETAVRQNLPIVILVLCDESLNLIEVIQKRRGYRQYGVRFNKINFASIAEDFGAIGVRIQSLIQLPNILRIAFEGDRPTLVEIPIDGSEYSKQL